MSHIVKAPFQQKRPIDPISGGSSLPEVTSADNGKTLSVVNGEWAAEQYAGYDLVVWYDYDDLQPTLLKGNYSVVRDKLANKVPVLAIMGASGAVAGIGSVASKGAFVTCDMQNDYIHLTGLQIGEGQLVCKFNSDGTVTDDSE